MKQKSIGLSVINGSVIDGANLFALLSTAPDKYNLSTAECFALANALDGKRVGPIEDGEWEDFYTARLEVR